jgi:cation diffusion facilitator CzcD-associated flavoprotein CzcO
LLTGHFLNYLFILKTLKEEKMNKKVVIIGGGLGGMSAGIRLAVDNYDVTIIEKGERLGGIEQARWKRVFF